MPAIEVISLPNVPMRPRWFDPRIPFITAEALQGGGLFNRGPPKAQRWNYLRDGILSFYKNGPCVDGTKICKTPEGRNLCREPDTPESPGKSGLVTFDCLRGEPGYKITLKDQPAHLNSPGWHELSLGSGHVYSG
jgi:hypothetical protein